MRSSVPVVRIKQIMLDSIWSTPRAWYLLGLLTFAVSFPLFPKLHSTTESLLVLLFLWMTFFASSTQYARRTIKHDPLLKLSLALLAFLLLAQLWYYVSRPDYIDASTRDARYYLKPVMVLVIGVGLSLCGRIWSWRFLLAALCGLLLYLALKTDLHTWVLAYKGHRTDFGIHNAEHTAMIFGSCLLALLVFTPRLIRATTGPAKFFVLSSLTFVISLMIFGVLVTQTRAAWLGLLLSCGVAILFTPWFLTQTVNSRHTTRYCVGLVACFAIITTVAIAGFNANDLITKRLARENITVETITAAASLESSPKTSSSVRIATWAAATHWIGERPWFGWGPDATESLIDHSDYFSVRFKDRFGHLHNSYLESLVANGLIGSLLLIGIAVWLGIAMVLAFRKGRLPADVCLFGLLYFVFWAVVNTFESYTLYPTGQYVNSVVGGFLYSFCLDLDKGDHESV